MSEEEKVAETQDPTWEQKTVNGPNDSLTKLALNLAKLHRLTIEGKLKEMKAHVTAECAKMNHPTADEFAAEINSMKID